MSDPGGAQRPRPIRPGPVIGGVVLGILAALIAQTALFLTLAGLPAFGESPALMYVSLLVPAVVGIGLLLSPRTRQAGAGLLLGMAVGAIVVGGVCTAISAAILANTG